ncbi:MAG TPA: hypothetical protein VJ327_11120 [Patescibacteria group bacterium]|nr:hypothetical protein [Patescibacteria group bacterium]
MSEIKKYICLGTEKVREIINAEKTISIDIDASGISLGDIIGVREGWAPFYYGGEYTSVVYSADKIDNTKTDMYYRKLIMVSIPESKRKKITGTLANNNEVFSPETLPDELVRIFLRVIYVGGRIEAVRVNQ